MASKTVKLCISPFDHQVIGRCDRHEDAKQLDKQPCCMCLGEYFVEASVVKRWVRLLRCDGIGSKQTVLSEMEKCIQDLEIEEKEEEVQHDGY